MVSPTPDISADVENKYIELNDEIGIMFDYIDEKVNIDVAFEVGQSSIDHTVTKEQAIELVKHLTQLFKL